MNLLKTAGATVLAGGIVLGSMVFFTGSDSIDSAISKIGEQTSVLQKFKSNETAMVNKINILKQQKAVLEAQLAEKELDEEEIEYLRSQIEELNIQIATLETEGHTALERITALESELNAANAKAAELQQTVDSVESIQPMTDEELEALLSTETIVETPVEEPVDEPAQPEETASLTYKIGSPKYEIFPGITIETPSGYPNQVKFSNTSGSSAVMMYYPGGTKQSAGNGYTKILPSGTEYVEVTFNGVTKRVNITK